ncbi:MAG: prenyltransferase/squalene oxidase repeat-containing protein, partial [Pirellulales bacterium]
KTAQSRGGSAGTEEAVEMGLDFLARHQSPDGRWSLNGFAQGMTEKEYQNSGLGEMNSDTAATGLALLSFFGAGYTHRDGKYRDVVNAGLAFLIEHQKADGDLFTGVGGSNYCWLYSHGIASIALCEAYGMTQDPAVREPAQKCLDFIAAAQEPGVGGWRYVPQVGSDTSVSGWQMMALKSGELAGLEVQSSCYPGVTKWLDTAQGASGVPSRYAYRPGAQFKDQREPSTVMTAEALLMRLYLGWQRNNPHLMAGADYLLENLPNVGTKEKSQRDAYYWYYATQVMFQVGGEHWKSWNDRLRPLLLEGQTKTGAMAGSWDPLGPVPDKWARKEGGRIYLTAMNLLMLEVYYRHLPLYQTLGEQELPPQ